MRIRIDEGREEEAVKDEEKKQRRKSIRIDEGRGYFAL